MKKLAVILMLAVMGLVFGCNVEEEQKGKVAFEPICRKPQPKDNYTITNWGFEECKECFRKNLVASTLKTEKFLSGLAPYKLEKLFSGRK